MSRIETTRYIKKALYVEAVRITKDNLEDIADWCQGEIQQDEVPGKGTKKFIRVRVHNPKNSRQTKAHIGDWLLYTDRGYKIYTNRAFCQSFDQAPEETLEFVQATSENIAQAVIENEVAMAKEDGKQSSQHKAA